MSLRHKSREFALQMLFQWEMSRQDLSLVERNFWKSARAAADTREFANQLFEGAVADAAALERLVAQHSKNWRSERMAAIDRAILHLAAYELRSTSTPAKAVIDEAVQLAKKFSSEDAVPFINGVLDAILKAIPE